MAPHARNRDPLGRLMPEKDSAHHLRHEADRGTGRGRRRGLVDMNAVRMTTGRRKARKHGLERPLVKHRGHIEVSRGAERFRAQELVDPRGPLWTQERLRQAGAKAGEPIELLDRVVPAVRRAERRRVQQAVVQ